MSVPSIDSPVELNLLVAFSDLTSFSRHVGRKLDSRDLFTLMSTYGEFVGDIVAEGGGHVVKFIGDAVLMFFPEDHVDSGVRALLALKEEGDAWWAARRMPCRHQIKAHFGTVTAGLLGTRDDKRLDILGHTVNTAAMVQSSGLALTPEAFRKLAPETRTLFKKHTPPVTYIPTTEPHRT